MYCKNCGKELSEGFAFCDKCGAPVIRENQTEVKNNFQAENSANTQTVAQQPYYKNKLIYNPPQQSAQQTYPTYQAPVQNNVQPVTTIGQYIAWLLIGLIPGIGTIIAIVLAIDSSNKNRSNFFRAQIVIVLAVTAFVAIFWSAIASALYDLLWSL